MTSRVRSLPAEYVTGRHCKGLRLFGWPQILAQTARELESGLPFGIFYYQTEPELIMKNLFGNE